MFLVTLTLYKSSGIFADPYPIFKWCASTEEEAFQFMERVVNVLDMEHRHGDSWYKEIPDVNEEYIDELVLDYEPLDTTVDVDNLEELLAAYK
jgi:hypothetical protein